MLSREIFGRGLQLINTVTQNPIVSESIDAYYLLLKDLDPDAYLNGIITLLKEKKNLYYPPSPAEIIEYHDREFSRSNSISEIVYHVKRDILLRGKGKIPPYRKEIKEAIEMIGGWDFLCTQSSDYIEKYLPQALKKNVLPVRQKNTPILS